MYLECKPCGRIERLIQIQFNFPYFFYVCFVQFYVVSFDPNNFKRPTSKADLEIFAIPDRFPRVVEQYTACM